MAAVTKHRQHPEISAENSNIEKLGHLRLENATETIQSNFLPCGARGISIIIPGTSGFLFSAGSEYRQKKAVSLFSHLKFWLKWKSYLTKIQNTVLHVINIRSELMSYCRFLFSSSVALQSMTSSCNPTAWLPAIHQHNPAITFTYRNSIRKPLSPNLCCFIYMASCTRTPQKLPDLRLKKKNLSGWDRRA